VSPSLFPPGSHIEGDPIEARPFPVLPVLVRVYPPQVNDPPLSFVLMPRDFDWAFSRQIPLEVHLWSTQDLPLVQCGSISTYNFNVEIHDHIPLLEESFNPYSLSFFPAPQIGPGAKQNSFLRLFVSLFTQENSLWRLGRLPSEFVSPLYLCPVFTRAPNMPMFPENRFHPCSLRSLAFPSSTSPQTTHANERTEPSLPGFPSSSFLLLSGVSSSSLKQPGFFYLVHGSVQCLECWFFV